MLVFVPAAPYGRLGVLLSALIVVFGCIGLTMHPDFYAGVRRKGYFAYYTALSNLLVLVYFALAAPLLYKNNSPLIPHAEFAVMMCIMLTCIVFHVLLLPMMIKKAAAMEKTRAFSILFWDNLIVHALVPLLTFFYWLLCGLGKEALGWADAFYFTLFPLGYLALVFVRAKLGIILPEENSVK